MVRCSPATTTNWLQRELVRPYYFTDNERLPQYATEGPCCARASPRYPRSRVLYGWSGEAIARDDDGVTVKAVERKGDGVVENPRCLCRGLRRQPL